MIDPFYFQRQCLVGYAPVDDLSVWENPIIA